MVGGPSLSTVVRSSILNNGQLSRQILSSTSRQSTLLPSSQRSFHTTPSNNVFEALRGTFQNIKDRGLKALGRKTSQDREYEKMIEDTQPKESKSLERLYRKRWGSPKKVLNPLTGETEERILEHKYSTANFQIRPRKLQDLARQIGGKKPIDYAILQMQFSQKRASNRIKSTLALARDHAIKKGLDPAKLVVDEAWVGKGQTHKRVEYKGRGRTGVRTVVESKLNIVLREGKSQETKFAEKLEKEKRIVRSIGTGGVVRVNRPIINAHQNPGWHW